jgi:uncharacterized protein YndB with AHSA1/START domain
MSNIESSVRMAEREIEIAREFAAPVQRVWQAWSDPEQVTQWFGPAGFRTVTQSREFRSGGHWRFTMIGPDGHEYLNAVDYVEIVPHALLRYRQGGGGDTAHISFEVEVRFEPCGAGNERTRLSMRTVFPSAEALRHVVETYGAIEGGKQTQARLAQFLAAQAGAAAASQGAAAQPFVLTRHFKAPRALLWQAWTDPQHLAAWMGPAGSTTLAAHMDLHVGGRYHYGLRTADGTEMWGLCEYLEIVAPERLVYVQSFSDPLGGLSRHPLAPTWPLRMLTTVTLMEHAGLSLGTTLELRWEPIDASAGEIGTFNGAHAGMQQGWGGSMAKLEAWVAQQA